MNMLDFLIQINAYDGQEPGKNNFKWLHAVKGVETSSPYSGEMQLAAGNTVQLFSGQSNTMIYIESNENLDIVVNGSATPNTIVPPTSGTARKPGVFFNTGDIQSVEITNTSSNVATVFYATVG